MRELVSISLDSAASAISALPLTVAQTAEGVSSDDSLTSVLIRVLGLVLAVGLIAVLYLILDSLKKLRVELQSFHREAAETRKLLVEASSKLTSLTRPSQDIAAYARMVADGVTSIENQAQYTNKLLNWLGSKQVAPPPSEPVEPIMRS
jgi:hypothetical protein